MRLRAVAVILFVFSSVIFGSPHRNDVHTSQRSTSGDGGQLVGTWKRVSRAVSLEDGTVVQDTGLGKTPKGYLMYDSSRHMAAQIMKLERPSAVDCSTSSSASSNNSQSVNGCDAYFGTYDVDETNHTVTHHLEGALAAGDVGMSLVRQFQLLGDKLVIVVRTNSPQGTQIRTLTWERVG